MHIKSFKIDRIAITASVLLMFSLLTNCSKSPEVSIISVNQTTETGKTPMTTPTPPSDLSKAPTISYCEMIRNPDKYDHQIVRLRAIYFNEFEKMYLFDEACEPDKTPTAPDKIPAETWAEWDKSLVSKGDSEEAKLNRELNGRGRKDVTVIGRFNSTDERGDKTQPNRFGHMNCCRYQFQIMRVEKIVMLP